MKGTDTLIIVLPSRQPTSSLSDSRYIPSGTAGYYTIENGIFVAQKTLSHRSVVTGKNNVIYIAFKLLLTPRRSDFHKRSEQEDQAEFGFGGI